MNIADPAPEPDAPLRTHTIKLPSRDQVTAVQVNTLLQAVQVLNHLAIARGGGVTEGAGGPDDGGVCAALDSTIIKALTQLDDIFDDSPRWTLASQSSLEKQLSEVYAANLDLLRVQKQAVLEVGLPHRIAGPKLLQLEGGAWAAVLGDAANMSNCILGIGDSPMAALLDFDEVFQGTKNKTNEQSKVVGNGDSTINGASGGGLDIQGDSDETGPDGGGGKV